MDRRDTASVARPVCLETTTGDTIRSTESRHSVGGASGVSGTRLCRDDLQGAHALEELSPSCAQTVRRGRWLRWASDAGWPASSRIGGGGTT